MGVIRFVGTVKTRGNPYLVCKKKVSLGGSTDGFLLLRYFSGVV